MCLRKTVKIALFMAVVVAVVAEPPAAYGPPSFNQFKNFRLDTNNYMRQTVQPELIHRGFANSGYERQYNVGYQKSGYQTGGYQSGGYHSGGYQTGGYQESYNPQPFNFQYEVKDPQSGNDFGHQASSNGNQVKGEYYVLLPDGRRQIVTYVADDNGYNANVHYEGQATVPQGGGYGGYSDNQYGGYSGNTGYRGNNGGYRGNNGGYRGDFGGYKGNFGGYRY